MKELSGEIIANFSLAFICALCQLQDECQTAFILKALRGISRSLLSWIHLDVKAYEHIRFLRLKI